MSMSKERRATRKLRLRVVAMIDGRWPIADRRGNRAKMGRIALGAHAAMVQSRADDGIPDFRRGEKITER